jgi:hypothetical protein
VTFIRHFYLILLSLQIVFRLDPEAGAPRRLGGVVTVDVDTGLQPESGTTHLVDENSEQVSKHAHNSTYSKKISVNFQLISFIKF